MRTIQRRLTEPEFRAAVEAVRNKLSDEAITALRGAGLAAARCLRRLLHSNSDAIKLGAARGIIDSILKSRETEIERRLAEVERRLGGQHDQKT